MHEINFLSDLFEDLMKRSKVEGIKKVFKVQLRMGEFTEINQESLRFFFKEKAKGTLLEGAALCIEKSPLRELRLVSFEGE